MGSAVGGLNRRLDVGDLTVIDDHINLMGVNPLVGPNDDTFGPRWPDMIEPYWQAGIDLAKQAALQRSLRLESAVYAGVLGPNLETRAEYRMLDRIGADIVGMSTVPEAIAAVHCGLKTIAFAIVTDRCLADCLEPADVSKIIAAANAAEPPPEWVDYRPDSRTDGEAECGRPGINDRQSYFIHFTVPLPPLHFLIVPLRLEEFPHGYDQHT